MYTDRTLLSAQEAMFLCPAPTPPSVNPLPLSEPLLHTLPIIEFYVIWSFVTRFPTKDDVLKVPPCWGVRVSLLSVTVEERLNCVSILYPDSQPG